MKLLISILTLFLSIVSNGQEATNTSFLSRNQPMELFSNISLIDAQSEEFKLKLPKEITLSQSYQSGFMNFMSNDYRVMNYPPMDLSELNDITFGSYMNTGFNLGNTSITTFYLFDHTGRMVDSTTSFSFKKKK